MPLSEKSIDIIKESLIHYYEELVKLFSQEELTEGSNEGTYTNWRGLGSGTGRCKGYRRGA